MNSTRKDVASIALAVVLESLGRKANVSYVKLCGELSVNETVPVPEPLYVPPARLAEMSNVFVTVRVNVITNVYCVPLSKPWLPLVAPLTRLLQLPLLASKSPLATLRLFNWKG